MAFYNLGKRIETAFVTTAGSFVVILFQPMFAHVGTETRGSALRRGVAVLTIVLGFPAAAFIPNREFLVTAVFGHQWTGAATVAAVLAVAGFVRAIGFVPGALMSVSTRNRDLLVTTFASAMTGAILVALTAPFGIVWSAVALLLKNAGILGWMAALLRDQVAEPAQIYFLGMVAPFLLMLCGTLAGHAMIGDAAADESTGRAVLMVIASVAPGALLGAAYFSLYFRQHLGDYVATLRGRWAARV